MIVGAGALAALQLAPVAAAAPPPGMPHDCERSGLIVFCDGPIGADKSWKRCTATDGYSIGATGAYMPGVVKCSDVTQDTLPEGSPQHHIGKS